MGWPRWASARDAVEVEVVRPGSRGLLGIGAEDAVVRLRVIGGGSAAQAAERQPEPPRQEPPPKRPVDDPADHPARPETPRGEGRPARGRIAGRRRVSSATERRDEGPGNARAARSQQSTGQAAGSPAATAVRTPTGEPSREGGTPVPEAMEKGREYLAGLLQRMNMKADVQIVQQTEAETSGERSSC